VGWSDWETCIPHGVRPDAKGTNIADPVWPDSFSFSDFYHPSPFYSHFYLQWTNAGRPHLIPESHLPHPSPSCRATSLCLPHKHPTRHLWIESFSIPPPIPLIPHHRHGVVTRCSSCSRIPQDLLQCQRAIRHPGCCWRGRIRCRLLCSSQALWTKGRYQEDHSVRPFYVLVRSFLSCSLLLLSGSASSYLPRC
jgi:hypothetical protein